MRWLKFCLIFLIIVIDLKGQSNLVGKTFLYNDTLYLRWLPSNAEGIEKCSKNGYLVKVIDWFEDKEPDSTHFKNSFGITVEPKNINDSFWLLSENNSDKLFLHSVLYGKNKLNQHNKNVYFGLAMLACDMDTSLAKAAGLFHYVIGNKNKAILIQPAEITLRKTIKYLILTTGKLNTLPKIDSLKHVTHNKEIKLIWPETKYKDYYCGYYVERSEDGSEFKRLNTKPHIQIKTNEEKNKTHISFNDTSVYYNKTYYYRIRGLNFFGPIGPLSNTIIAKCIQPIKNPAIIKAATVYQDSLVKISWEIIKSKELETINKIEIYRAEGDDKTYQKISSQSPVLLNEFIDSSAHSTSFYKLCTYNIYGDSSFSHSAMVVLPDIKPPAIPLEFTGDIDSSGNVKLSWRQNIEKDILGYRIFRSNSLNEEQVEVSKEFIKTNYFEDRIELNTLTPDIYYYITAVDLSFNNSPYSDPIRLIRPDTIKPIPIIFTKVVSTDSGIVLNWVNSSSIDIVISLLYRINEDKSEVLINQYKSIDSITQFLDRPDKINKLYRYKMIVKDNSGNINESLSYKCMYVKFFENEIKDFRGKIDIENKLIKLLWQKPNEPIFSFILYKKKNDGPWLTFKTLKSNFTEFNDNELNIGNIYQYRIKAIFENGKESNFSNNVKLEF